jgi:hypothetical protein
MHTRLGEASDGQVDLNNSRAVGCSCAQRMVWPSSAVPEVKRRPIFVNSLNSSDNHATVWSCGLDVGERTTVEVLFCRLHSCGPVNVLLLFYSAGIYGKYHCAEFFNNTETLHDVRHRGPVAISANCEFHDCLFVSNTATAIFVCDSDAPNQIVTLKRFVFDVAREGQALGSFSVTFEIGECEWQPDRKIEVDAAIRAPPLRPVRLHWRQMRG